jgi:hypothetical protein
MHPIRPIFASEATAAKLLDMKKAEFQHLVAQGHLPDGKEIAPGRKRWSIDLLQRIGGGQEVSGLADVKW